jgi:hypothetical protein
MRIVSHRGNLTGPDKDKENTEPYLLEALERGFDIEFDIWYMGSKFWLGHDVPTKSFSIDTLIQWATVYQNQNFYVHCKHVWALEQMVKTKKKNIIPFFHDIDQCILLSDYTIWVHPNAINAVSVRENCIAVFPACKTIKYDINYDVDFERFHGICTDYPLTLRNSL